MLTIEEAAEFDQQVVAGILQVLLHGFILEGLRFCLIDGIPLGGKSFEQEDARTSLGAEACRECLLAHQLVDVVAASQMKHCVLEFLLNDRASS